MVGSKSRTTPFCCPLASALLLREFFKSELRPTSGEDPAPFHDEIRGSRSDYVRQEVLETTTRGLLPTNLVILQHGRVTKTIPELGPPLQCITPRQREDFEQHTPAPSARH
ncbi:hypothetical protein TNCV_664771 [Trichonephila clavipes]|nr:hypothetical protein TNCV_664771 [Trichonephila clavipes]